MLYFTALAVIGFACAAALRWPVMFLIAMSTFVMSFAVQWGQGVAFGFAALIAVASFLILQVCYVLGGLALSVRIRMGEAKKNIEA
jgi:hypothetical protein